MMRPKLPDMLVPLWYVLIWMDRSLYPAWKGSKPLGHRPEGIQAWEIYRHW